MKSIKCKCPLCDSNAIGQLVGDLYYYDCDRCKKYEMSGSTMAVLECNPDKKQYFIDDIDRHRKRGIIRRL